MAAPTIPNGETQFFPIIYEGNGKGQRVGKFVPFTDNGTIANSLIFNDGDSPYMRRTPSGASNRKTFTISFWVKRCQSGVLQLIIAQGADHNNSSTIAFSSSDQLRFGHNDSGSTTYALITNRTFEDTSKFYHILASFDTTQSTASDRVKLYVDGDLMTSFATSTYPPQDFDLDFNSTGTIAISGQIPSGTLFPFDGYLAEVNLVDGTALTPDTFGLTNTSTGRWIPKALTGITYGTNGFRLKFQDSSALGDDTSGNTNDFGTVNGLVAGDQTTDSPTQNHATLEDGGNGGTLSEGNLKLATTTSQYNIKCATLRPKSGKYYAEFKQINSGGRPNVGVALSDNMPYSGTNVFTPVTPVSSNIPGYGYYGYNGIIYTSLDGGPTFTTVNSTGTTYAQNDIIGIALDLDTPQVSFYKNNSLVITLSLPSGSNGYSYFVGDTAAGYSATWECNFGQKSFAYTPPTGFVALQQDNLPETAKGITGFTWIKDRDNALNHNSYDSSNGVFNRLVPNNNSTILNTQSGVSKFLKGGIAVGDLSNINNSGASMVSWNWVANGGVTSTNNDGSISSTVQVNSDAGFSIVQGKYFQGTMGHGLSQTPEWIIYKETSPNANSWYVWHKGLTSTTYYLLFDSTQAQTNYGATLWAPTSTTFSTNLSLSGDRDAIAYCWHGVDGFSKFGRYEGNANSNGPFVYLGFRPAFLMIKNADRSVDWIIIDSKRDPFNDGVSKLLKPSSSAAESEANNQGIDLLSNGFKIRQSSSNAFNASSETHIYMAFAEHPFVGDGTSPVTAR